MMSPLKCTEAQYSVCSISVNYSIVKAASQWRFLIAIPNATHYLYSWTANPSCAQSPFNFQPALFAIALNSSHRYL